MRTVGGRDAAIEATLMYLRRVCASYRLLTPEQKLTTHNGYIAYF